MTHHDPDTDTDSIAHLLEPSLSPQLAAPSLSSKRQRGLVRVEPSTTEWLKTARNLVKFGGGTAYKDAEQYLRSVKLY